MFSANPNEGSTAVSGLAEDDSTDDTHGADARRSWLCANDAAALELRWAVTLGGCPFCGDPIGRAVPDVACIEQLDKPSRDRSVPPLGPCSGRGVSASANAANGDGPGPRCTRCSGQCWCEPGTIGPSTPASFAVDVNGDAPVHPPQPVGVKRSQGVQENSESWEGTVTRHQPADESGLE